jgi:hypothetical protein
VEGYRRTCARETLATAAAMSPELIQTPAMGS